MEKNEKMNENWICLEAKSRPGRFYMFNKTTGETKWLPLIQEKKDTVRQISEYPPKISFSKSTKTPAQDRLKRLQNSLSVIQTRSQSNRATRISPDLGAVNNQPENRSYKQQMPTSSTVQTASKSQQRAIKRSSSSCYSDKASPEEEKKLRLSVTMSKNIICPSPSTSSKSLRVETPTNSEPQSSKSIVPNTADLQIMGENNSSRLNSLCTGFVKKVIGMYKNTFKRNAEEKSRVKEEISSRLMNTTQFKHKKRTGDSKRRLFLAGSKEESADTPDHKALNNLNIPSYPRGSVNLRLEKLKQSLLSQHNLEQKHSLTTKNSKTSEKTLNLSPEGNKINTTSLKLKDVYKTDHNNTINSLPHAANSTITKDVVEPMDWQTVVKDNEPVEMTLVVEKSKKLVVDKCAANEIETMGDIYDRVNENLLRFSAEQQKDYSNSSKQWRRDFYYFIVDTNVLLRDLTFVEDLTKIKLCDTKGTMLYIPYAVLQELDKLKLRSGCQEGVKTRAVHAIKYLNSKFENNSPHLQAQSALDERQHIVDVNSADDSIINCCLQAKKYVRNLLLLTEDVNLRNKAICNNILVSTKSDLVSKRNDSENHFRREKI